MFTVDLHTHTRFFHGYPGRPTKFDPIGADLLVRFARWRGLDGVAVTNHDYFQDIEVDSKLTSIPGIEVTTTDGHVLVIGPDPPSRATPGELTPSDVIDMAHESDCAAIIAHPFRRSSLPKCTADFDAVELNGKNPQFIKRVESLAKNLGLSIVGGSDAHFPFEVGRVITKVDTATLTPTAVATAIRKGRVEPRIRRTRLNQIVQAWYRYLHRYTR